MGYEKLSRETSPVEASGQKKKNFLKALSYFLIIHLTAGNGAVHSYACIKQENHRTAFN